MQMDKEVDSIDVLAPEVDLSQNKVRLRPRLSCHLIFYTVVRTRKGFK